MALHPKMSSRTAELLARSVDEISDQLVPGWRGNAGSARPDLTAFLASVEVGLVGITAQSPRGLAFLAHTALSACGTEPDHAHWPLLGRLDDHQVLIVSLPVWAMLLEMAVQDGLAVLVGEDPDAPEEPQQAEHQDGDDADAEGADRLERLARVLASTVGGSVSLLTAIHKHPPGTPCSDACFVRTLSGDGQDADPDEAAEQRHRRAFEDPLQALVDQVRPSDDPTDVELLLAQPEQLGQTIKAHHVVGQIIGPIEDGHYYGSVPEHPEGTRVPHDVHAFHDRIGGMIRLHADSLRGMALLLNFVMSHASVRYAYKIPATTDDQSTLPDDAYAIAISTLTWPLLIASAQLTNCVILAGGEVAVPPCYSFADTPVHTPQEA